jgi:hypothetical protein
LCTSVAAQFFQWFSYNFIFTGVLSNFWTSGKFRAQKRKLLNEVIDFDPETFLEQYKYVLVKI